MLNLPSQGEFCIKTNLDEFGLAVRNELAMGTLAQIQSVMSRILYEPPCSPPGDIAFGSEDGLSRPSMFRPRPAWSSVAPAWAVE